MGGLEIVTIHEYERVRRDPTHFAVTRDHVDSSIEDIVEETGYFLGSKRTRASRLRSRRARIRVHW
jgi:hypothetical protein